MLSASFIIAASSKVMGDYIEKKLQDMRPELDIKVVSADTREVLRQARAAIVASGTATVETALMGCPMVVVYKVSLMTYLICRALIKIENIGMVNIIAGKTICPELVQYDAKPDKIANALLPLVDDGGPRNTMLKELEAVRQSLGSGNVEEKAADVVCSELKF